jgi:hypothetical protein
MTRHGLNPRPFTTGSASKLAKFCARKQDSPLLRAEVHEHGPVFHAEYDAEPILVVRHLIAYYERLSRARRSRGTERASGQVALGRAARCLHSYYHAPSRAQVGVPAGRHALPHAP